MGAKQPAGTGLKKIKKIKSGREHVTKKGNGI